MISPYSLIDNLSLLSTLQSLLQAPPASQISPLLLNAFIITVSESTQYTLALLFILLTMTLRYTAVYPQNKGHLQLCLFSLLHPHLTLLAIKDQLRKGGGFGFQWGIILLTILPLGNNSLQFFSLLSTKITWVRSNRECTQGKKIN